MNPLFRSSVGLLTLSSFVVGAHDGGKTQTPPASVVGHLLVNVTVSTSSVLQGVPVIPNAVTGKMHDTAELRQVDLFGAPPKT